MSAMWALAAQYFASFLLFVTCGTKFAPLAVDAEEKAKEAAHNQGMQG